MTRLLKTALLSTALVFATTGLAQAQQAGACLPHATAVGELSKGYDEHSVGVGLGNNGEALFELFVAETGTWTILVTGADGTSCIAASGDSWMGSQLLAGDPI